MSIVKRRKSDSRGSKSCHKTEQNGYTGTRVSTIARLIHGMLKTYTAALLIKQKHHSLSVIALIGPFRKLTVDVAIELAPLIVAVDVALCCCCTCVELMTADTANLALAVSSVNLDVGCEEKECSNVGYGVSRSQVWWRRSCSCCSLCICSNCSW